MVVLGFNAVVESTEVGVRGRDWRSVEWGGLFHCYLPLQLWASYRNPAPAQLAVGWMCCSAACRKSSTELLCRQIPHAQVWWPCWQSPHGEGEGRSAPCKGKPLTKQPLHWRSGWWWQPLQFQNSQGIPCVYDHVQVFFNMTLTLGWICSRGFS